MKNDYHIGNTKISIPPTLLFSTIATMEDIRKAVTMDAKKPGHLVYVLGTTYPELGGSEWYALHDSVGNSVPRVRAEQAKRLYERISEAMQAGLVASCHDCSDGGIGVALAEVAFSGGLGIDADLSSVPQEGVDRDDHVLFSESQSRFIVTIPPESENAFRKMLQDCVVGRIGIVTARETLKIRGIRGTTIIEEGLGELKAAWQKPLDF
jgi:phosphoribosylformylglycinamidine synthase